MSRHQQEAYWQMMFRAEYYTWCALRGHSLPGNDPQHGIRRSGLYPVDGRAESRVAYKAMAKYWIQQAANYRSA